MPPGAAAVQWNGTDFERLLVEAVISVDTSASGTIGYNVSQLLGRGRFMVTTISASGSGEAPAVQAASENYNNAISSLTHSIRLIPRAGGIFRVQYVTDDGCRYGTDDGLFAVTCNAHPDATATQSLYHA